jgi:ribonuclease VapC
VSLVVDSSAVLAILLDEPTAPAIALALEASDDNTMSAASFVESTIVAEARLGPAGGGLVLRIVREAHITLVDVTTDVALDAIDGWRTYGKGNHRAALTFGDCFTYVLAARSGRRVLCTGNDFGSTDLIALPG